MIYKVYTLTLFMLLWVTMVGANVRFDFDGDRKSDLAVNDSAVTGEFARQYYWHILGAQGGYSITQWGAQDSSSQNDYYDIRVPSDYDGDGKTDIAVWRFYQSITTRNQCYFYILYSATNTVGIFSWGLGLGEGVIDYPVPADYDGDGKVDIAIARDTFSNGIYWWILQSRDGLRVQRWGGNGFDSDYPNPADYDGDGKTELAIFRKSPNCSQTAQYWINGSLTGSQVIPFGNCNMSAIE